MPGNRLAIIGNSHVAALKGGYDLMVTDGSLPEDLEVTFFAGRATAILNMTVQEGPQGRLVLAPASDDLAAAIAHTSGGRTQLDFEDYDEVALVGMNRVPLCDERTSSAVRRWAFAGIATHSATSRMLGWIRQCSDLPVRAVPMPLPSGRPALPPHFRPMPYAARVAELGSHFKVDAFGFVLQPEPTLADEVATRGEFSAGSTRLDVGDTASGLAHTESDLDHMNAMFGVHQLRAIFDDLYSRQPAVNRS